MKKLIPPVKGTRDYYPEQMAVRTWLYDTVRNISESFGYQEWDAPFLESIDLYAAKSGEELVKKQSYAFIDRGGDEITLRPELTPSLARIVAARQDELIFPVRWWSFGPFWRYERPGRGRVREFFQWNIDLIGADSPEADAELVAIAASFMKKVGLSPTQVRISVNNRRFMDREFDAIRIPQTMKAEIFSLVDRRGKMTMGEWEIAAGDLHLSSLQLDGLKSLLTDGERWQYSEELVRLFKSLEMLGVKEYVQFDPGIVRGLLYYTGTVFEAFDLSGSVKRAILGGGRYDNLLGDVGGNSISSVGFAMGDVVLGLILQEQALLPSLPVTPASLLVTFFSTDVLKETCSLAADLRAAGINVIFYPEPAKLARQFKYADRMRINLVLVMGPDEVAAGNVTIKDLKDGGQKTVTRASVIDTITGYLNTSQAS